jgi:hypothetical protein
VASFDDVMKDMKAKASFAQRESAVNTLESAPRPPTQSATFMPPPLKPVLPVQRQRSLPEPSGLSSTNRRASESDFLVQSRKCVVGEFERYYYNYYFFIDCNLQFVISCSLKLS